jgi:hypothetical protein
LKPSPFWLKRFSLEHILNFYKNRIKLANNYFLFQMKAAKSGPFKKFGDTLREYPSYLLKTYNANTDNIVNHNGAYLAVSIV